MIERKRIADNESPAEILALIQSASAVESLWKAFPLLQEVFPKLRVASEKLAELKQQSKILLRPDRFNEIFSQSGWIAYESMSTDVMEKAISAFEQSGLDAAEEYLASTYDADALSWGIQRFKGHVEFRKRIRLVELAKVDYLSGRYHACIPLLLSLIDGLVTDISKHVGFFADNVDLTAWDCIAAHESGLQTLAALLTKGRNKTNDEPISVPYRHGILHGRELAFDNQIVAAKTWAAIFAIRDWAGAIADGKKNPSPRKESSWSELLQSIRESEDFKQRLARWHPRKSHELQHLPSHGLSGCLPENSPERAVAELMEAWLHGRFGHLADRLSHTYAKAAGKKAGDAKRDFGGLTVRSYVVVSAEDTAPAFSKVALSAVFLKGGSVEEFNVELAVSAIYQDVGGRPLCRDDPGGSWRIVQNSFGSVIYGK